MTAILGENPLLLLFVVAALGYLIGNIPIRGSKLGVAAVLFVGLGFGGLDSSLQIPEFVLMLGLAMFVYSIGLSNGPGFFASFSRKGRKQLGFLALMLLVGAFTAVGVYFLFGFSAATSAGIYAGSTTSTAALAGVLDILSQRGITEGLDQAVIGYSLSYPMGASGAIIAMVLFLRLWKMDYKQDDRERSKEYPIDQLIENRSILVNNQELCNIPIRDLRRKHKWQVVFGRLMRNHEVILSNWDTKFRPGDIIRVAGVEEELDMLSALLGESVDVTPRLEENEYQHLRVFISNSDVAGKQISALNLEEQFSAIISRVRRGDNDLLANGDTVLELGDQIRFVARKRDIPGLKKLFGDSYHSLSQINLFSFGLGMALGLLLGMITFELTEDIRFRLGFAGGPLIMALILGKLRRTGNIVWTLPYSANLTLRQIGLIFLLATIGVRSGHTFFSTLNDASALYVFLGGTLISLGTAMLMYWVGYRFFKIPFSILSGMMANQPAILDFALTRTGNQLPSVGFALMFPIALIAKIVIAQILFLLL
ncbi:MAG: aspartate:alanine exchanger family transporter [Bacteroidia bacterium]